jgi:hypothetical protein
MIGLFDTASAGSLVTGLSSDLLAGWYGARASAAAASAASNPLAAVGKSDFKSVIPPWDVRFDQPTTDERLRDALGSGAFIDEAAAKLSSADATPSEHKLFALYSALAKLSAIAGHAGDKTTPEIMLTSLNARFGNGLQQVLDYAGSINETDLVVLPGEKARKLDAGIEIPRHLSTYTTKIVHRSATIDAMAQLTGAEQFTIAVTKGGVTTNVEIDLSDLGAGSPSLDAVIGFLNQRMQDEGMVTRFKKERVVALDKDGKEPSPLPQTWALKIEGTSTEKLSFSAPGSGTAVYLAGNSGKTGQTTAQMLKLDATGASPTLMTSARIEATNDDTGATPAPPPTGTPPATSTSAKPDTSAQTSAGGSAIDSDGNLYVVGTTEGSLGGEVLQGTSDVYLTKFDSTGQVVWQRMLGAAEAAVGAAVAVDASGNVVIAGRVKAGFDGSLSNTSLNSFVTKLDRSGQELFTRDVGPLSDDGAAAVAIGADGSIYFGGRTKGAIAGGATSAGGEDAIITKLSSSGSLLYTRQLGTSGNDRVTGLGVGADGNLVALMMQGSHAIVTKFDASNGSAPALWSQDLGDLAGGEAAALAIDAGRIYVGGATNTGAVGGGTVHGSYLGGSDGFYVALDGTGSTQTTSFLGTLSTDRIRAITAVGGEVYVAGETSGDLGGGVTGAVNGFAAKFDAAGDNAWTYQYSGRNGEARAYGINVDANGSSVLDLLGLPKGRIDYTEATTITAQSTVRAGDEFSISVNGAAPRKITIKASETLNSLTFKINAVLLLDGKASVRRVPGASTLRIAPSGPGVRIDFIAGAGGKDALKGLGLPEGTIIDTSTTGAASGSSSDPVLDRIFGTSEDASAAPNYVGLGLDSALKIDSRAAANNINQTLQAAMASLRTVFRTLNQDPRILALLNSPNGNKDGKVPAYLTQQIANYQAGLARLTSGGPDISALL